MFSRHKPLTTVVFMQLMGLKVVIIDFSNFLYYNIYRVVKSMPSLLRLGSCWIKVKTDIHD